MSTRTEPARGEDAKGDVRVARDADLDPVQRAVRGLRYGEVRVIIQDGVIVQIERIEKRRLC